MNSASRPHVVVQMGASIDGRITFGPGLTQFDRHPAERLLPDGGPLTKLIDAQIEADWKPQGIMMGSRTVESTARPPRDLPPAEGPADLLHEDFLPADVVAQTTRWLILVDGTGRCRSGYKGTETPGSHIIHLVSHAAPDAYLAFLRRERLPYLIGGGVHADLCQALGKLRTVLGLRAVKLWGGGTLNGAMLRLGLIDEIHLVVWPLLTGGSATPTLADGVDLGAGQLPARLRLISASPRADGQVWLHYRILRDDPTSAPDRADPSSDE